MDFRLLGRCLSENGSTRGVLVNETAAIYNFNIVLAICRARQQTNDNTAVDYIIYNCRDILVVRRIGDNSFFVSSRSEEGSQ